MSCARSVCVHVCGLEDDNDFHSRGASAAPTRHSANTGALAPERLLPSRAPKFGHQTTEHGRENLSPWVSEAGRQCRMISHPPDAPPMRPKGRANPALRLSASASSPGCRRVRGRRTGGEGGPAPAGSSRAVSVAGLLPAAAFGFIPTASAAGSQPTACLLHAGGLGGFSAFSGCIRGRRAGCGCGWRRRPWAGSGGCHQSCPELDAPPGCWGTVTTRAFCSLTPAPSFSRRVSLCNTKLLRLHGEIVGFEPPGEFWSLFPDWKGVFVEAWAHKGAHLPCVVQTWLKAVRRWQCHPCSVSVPAVCRSSVSWRHHSPDPAHRALQVCCRLQGCPLDRSCWWIALGWGADTGSCSHRSLPGEERVWGERRIPQLQRGAAVPAAHRVAQCVHCSDSHVPAAHGNLPLGMVSGMV